MFWRVSKILSCTYNIRKYMCKYCKDICCSSWYFSEIHYHPSQKIEENACTLVPTVFRWHGKMLFKFHFHFFFRFRMTLKNRYEFRFPFSHHFEKRIWTSLFVSVFASLTLKKGYEFLFSFSHHFEKRIWISFLYGLLESCYVLMM